MITKENNVSADDCKHDYKNPVRKGRAHYVCKLCGEDITIELVYFEKSLQNRKNDSTKTQID